MMNPAIHEEMRKAVDLFSLTLAGIEVLSKDGVLNRDYLINGLSACLDNFERVMKDSEMCFEETR